LDIFTYQKALNEGVWKVPVYRPPTDTSIELRDIKNLVPIPNAFVYMRLVSSGSSSPIVGMEISPENNIHKYRIPPSHQRDAPGMLQPPQKPQSPATPMQYLQPSQPSQASLVPQSAESYLPRNPVEEPPKHNFFTNAGVGAKLQSLIDTLSKNHLKFRVTLQEDDEVCLNDRGEKCIWTSEVINPLGSDVLAPSNNKRIPGTQIWGGKQGDTHSNYGEAQENNQVQINKKAEFFKNFAQMLEAKNWSTTLYLVIEVLEKSSQRINTPEPQNSRNSYYDSFVPIGWTVYQVSDPDQKRLNFQTIELSLFEPPVQVPVDDLDALELKDSSIALTVFEPSPGRAPSIQESIRRPVSNFSNPKKEEAFLENLYPQYDDSKYFERGDGVDFYVDGARFLGDNVSCCKIIVKAFTINLEKVGDPVGGLPDLDSSCYSPKFGFRTEYRQQSFDPTTTIVISIVTIDTKHNEVRVVGYSAINMFLNKYRRDQPSSYSEQDFILNKGNFQIPVYCEEPYRKPPFSMESFKDLERVPSGSLLVRIKEAVKTDDGLNLLSVKDVLPNEWYARGIVVPPPRYEDRNYNTSYCVPTNVERQIYKDRLSRSELNTRDATNQIQNQLGYRLDLNDEQMLDWIDEKLQVNQRTPLIDMKYFAKYSPRLGFKVAVDAIHNAPGNNPHSVVFCLNPPGALYRSTVVTQDVQCNSKLDFGSSIKTQVFLDGYHTYKNTMYDRNLHLIVDVRAINYNRKKVEVLTVGWTLLPIFSSDGYVNSGTFQVPLFKGPVPQQILADLTTNDPWRYVLNLVGKRNGIQFLETASVIVRVVDTQRDGHYNLPLDLQRMNYSYIPEQMLTKYSYNAAAHSKAQQSKKLRTFIPSNFDQTSYLELINKTVAEYLGLNHLV